MKTKAILIIVWMLLSIPCLAQQMEPGDIPTPNASDLGRYGEIPVSYYTGRPNVSIPIHTMNIRGLDFPISLQYDASGVLLNSLPGWTGHNWTLLAGGAITRIRQGHYDEYVPENQPTARPFSNYFHCYGKLVEHKDSTDSLKHNVLYDRYDYQPDIFTFSFLGKSGRFFLGNDGQWKVLSEDNIDVVFNVNDTSNYISPFIRHLPYEGFSNEIRGKVIKGFTLRDDRGYVYEFGGTNDAIDYEVGFYLQTEDNPNSFFPTTWYLTRIKDRFGNTLYELSYERGMFIAQLYNNANWMVVHQSVSYPPYGHLTLDEDTNNYRFPYDGVLNAPVYLKSIKSADNVYVEFISDYSNRSTDEMYPNIDVYDKYPDTDHFSNTFFYYLQTDDIEVTPYQYTDNYQMRRMHPLSATRLKELKRIVFLEDSTAHAATKTTVFSYDYYSRMHLTDVKSIALCDDMYDTCYHYHMDYDSYHLLPADYLSNAFDHWGYYNGMTSNNVNSCNRTPNSSKANYGQLSKITYPTGGFSRFTYELNDFSCYSSPDRQSMIDSISIAGGLRIKTIKDYSGTGNTTLCRSRSFTYNKSDDITSSGELFALPQYAWNQWEASTENEASTISISSGRFTSIIPLSNSFGPHVGYSRVKEAEEDGTYTVYEYNNISAAKDQKFLKTLTGTGYYPNEDPTPFDMFTERGYRRGKLLSVSDHDSNGDILKRITFGYPAGNVETDSVLTTNIKHNNLSNSTYFSFYTGGIYKLLFPKYDVVADTTVTYYTGGQVVTTRQYNKTNQIYYLTYPYAHQAMTRLLTSETMKRGGNTVRKEYQYPTSQNSVLYPLITKYFNLQPVGEKNYYNNTLTGGVRTDYALFPSGHPLPKEQLRINPDNTCDTIVRYLSYTPLVSLERFQKTGQPLTRLAWNTFRNETDLWGVTHYKDATESPQECHSTSYGFVPLKGLEWMMYPNDNEMNWEYDGFGRLTDVQDSAEYIIRRYRYHDNDVVTVNMLDAYEYGGEYNPITEEDSLRNMKVIQYYDGLGRPSLTADGTANTDGSYVYSLQTYDMLGREQSAWMPVAGSSVLSNMSASAFQQLSASAYGNSYAHVDNGYDALNRQISLTNAGQAWHASPGAGKSTEYITNGNNQVRRYALPSTGSSPSSYTYYPAGSLEGEVATDEDGHSMTVYKDMRGLKVLERRGTNADTYYIYDDLGQLRFVLLPLYISVQPEQLSYEYRYDSHGNVVWERQPGCQHTQYWYDAADRLTFMQDAMMRGRLKYRFFLYDGYGRLAVQGTCSACPTASVSSSLPVAAFSTSSTGFAGTGYQISSLGTVTNPQVEIVNYYDDYSFLSSAVGSGFSPVSASSSVNVNGLLTGNVTAASDGTLLYSLTLYDTKGRVRQTRRTTLDGGVEISDVDYSFTEQPTTSAYQLRKNSQTVFAAEAENHYYSTNDKLQYTDLAVGVGSSPSSSHRIQSIEYNDIGQVESITRPGSAGAVSYEYDVHGWTTDIDAPSFTEELYYAGGDGCSATPCYNGNISAQKWTNANYAQKRGYRFTYDNMNRLTEAVYGERDDLSDHQNRYNEKVVQYSRTGAVTRLQRRGLKNDGKYGKIDNLHITLKGNRPHYVLDDAENLTYAGAFEFQGDETNGSVFGYNINGNIYCDTGKGVMHIRYDDNNNPRRVQFANGNVTEYVYTATGEKLRTVHYTAVPNIEVGSGETHELTPAEILFKDSTDYHGSLIIENGVPVQYLFDGGYCKLTDGSGNPNISYHYYDRDHLGNIRGVVDENGTVEQITNYYPFGAPYSDATTTNPTLQRYKYNGKELELMHGLKWYDYGARWYDPLLVNWNRPDPSHKDYYPWSPYAYCADNPVNAVDPDGRKIVIVYQANNGNYYNLTFNGSGKYRYPKSQFVKDFFDAYNYNIKNGGGKYLKEAAQDPYHIHYLYDATDKNLVEVEETSFNPQNGRSIIQWESRKGLKTSNNGFQSAATRLEHEFYHAVDNSKNPSLKRQKSKTPDNQYDNIEEKEAVLAENETAILNGESTRKNHKGTVYPTISPISVLPLK